MWRPRIRAAVVLCVIAFAGAAPITAFAGLSSIESSGVLTIDLTGGTKKCGNGNGNRCSTSTTTTTTTTPTTTTAPTTTTTTTAPTTTTTTTASTTTTTTKPDGSTTTTSPATTTTTRPAATRPSTTTPQPPATTTTTSPATGGADDGDSGVAPGGPGTSPPSGGLGSVDMSGMPSSMAGAVEMMRSTGDTGSTEADATVADGGMGMMSDGLYDVLSPVLPPALVDAVSSPLVILDALIGALASSGQALIVPAIAFLFGFGVPSVRRRTPLRDLGAAR